MTSPSYHPLANIFPLIEGADFTEFCAGLKSSGRLHDKIVLLDNKILDGRNRQRGCEATGVTAHYRVFDPKVEGDPQAFVIAKNLTRRHLNESQRAMVAARLANMPAHRPTATDDKSANLQTSQPAAAAALNISTRSVAAAAKVQAKGTPELQRAVEQGHLPVSTAEKMADMPASEQKRIVAASVPAKLAGAAKVEVKKIKRDAKEADLGGKQLAAINGKFGLIVEDYEWDHVTWSEAGKDRAAGNHYPVSRDAHTADEIVEKTKDRFACADDDCVVWMWATVPHLAIAIDVLRKRGFEYKSHYIWCKDSIITGYWSRSKHEVLLIGVKGDIPCPAMGTQDASLITGSSSEHSVKPESAMRMIERYFPTLPKIELNARKRRPGWQVWGHDAKPAEPWRIECEREALARGLIEAGNMVRTTPSSVIAFDYVTEMEWRALLADPAVPRIENVTTDSGNLLPKIESQKILTPDEIEANGGGYA